MPRVPSAGGGALPRWLIVAGSAAIVYHLAAIIIPILDMPSGLWVTGQGPGSMPAPEFAHAAAGLANWHADYLRIAHSYHFDSNRPGDIPGVRLEVRLHKDGNIETLRFPDPNANPWLRHRQEIFVRSFAPDQSLESPRSDIVYPAGQEPDVPLWALHGEKFPPTLGEPPPADSKEPLEFRSVPQHLIPRYRGPMRPSDVSLVLARSFARYLCRTHGATKAEIVRITQEPVAYSVLLGGTTPELDEVVASYGEMSE